MRWEKVFVCTICGEVVSGCGNNPWPVSDFGECCDCCNSAVVIPARLAQLKVKEINHAERN